MRLVSSVLGAALMFTATLPAAAAVTGFVGPWAPTLANGFTNSVAGSLSTFTTTVSPDGLTLTSHLDNNGDIAGPSFFLQNYANILPHGPFSYDYSIVFHSPTGFGYEYDDFGRSAPVSNGDIISGSVAGLYDGISFGGYFGYFGVNVDDGNGTASATVTLTNFSGPGEVPEPISPIPSFSHHLEHSAERTGL